MREISKKFGNLLKKARKQKELSLRDVGKGTGISYSYLSQLESGLRGLPGFTVFHNLCDFYPKHAKELASFYPEESVNVAGGKSFKDMLEDITGTKLAFAKGKNETNQLPKGFSRLSEEGKKDLLQYLDYLLIKEKKKDKN